MPIEATLERIAVALERIADSKSAPVVEKAPAKKKEPVKKAPKSKAASAAEPTSTPVTPAPPAAAPPPPVAEQATPAPSTPPAAPTPAAISAEDLNAALSEEAVRLRGDPTPIFELMRSEPYNAEGLNTLAPELYSQFLAAVKAL